MKQSKKCPACGDEVIGRSDKKFCNAYCKSSFHYQAVVDGDTSLFRKIDKQLKNNRKTLKRYNKAGKAIVRKEELLDSGFDPKYFTHYWKNKKQDIYLFCYEYGFLEIKENNKTKYLLVKWQSYMR